MQHGGQAGSWGDQAAGCYTSRRQRTKQDMAVGVGRRRGRKDRVIEDLQLREATTVSAFTWE